MPPISLSRLRVRKQLVEINLSELAFNLEETKIFMNDVMGVVTTPEEIKILNYITEGWAAGLQLAALSLQDGRNVKDFLNDFAGSNRHILDYLTEEIISQQNQTIKDFLFKTSIFEQFSAPLCNYVLNIDNSQVLIEQLERSNIFIDPLDENRQWYRYHKLFSDILKLYQERQFPIDANQMHMAACQWLEEHGYSELAIHHALAAGDSEKAADIVEACAFKAILAAKMTTVLQWIDRLPLDVYRKRPRLGIYCTLANIPSGYINEADQRLTEVENLLAQGIENNDDLSSFERQSRSIRAVLTSLHGDYRLGIELCDQAFSQLKNDGYFFHGMIKYFSHYAFLALNKIPEAIESLEFAAQNAKRQHLERQDVYFGSLLGLARVYKHCGRLHDAVKAYEDILNYANKDNLNLEVARIAESNLSDIFYEWNRCNEADELMRRAYEYFSKYGSSTWEWYYSPDLPFLFAKNSLLHSDFERVEQLLQLYSTKNEELFPIPFADEMITSLRIRAWFVSGNDKETQKWANDIQFKLDNNLEDVTRTEKFEFLRVLLKRSKNNISEWMWLLDNILRTDQHIGPVDLQIEQMIIVALIWHSMGEKIKAKEALLKALHFGETGGYTRIFVEEGATMEMMLSELQAENIEQHGSSGSISPSIDYVSNLLKNFKSTSEQKPNDKSTSNILLPVSMTLSPKEIEVLKLLAESKSKKSIAQQMVVSINTVNTHIKHIYRKLEAHNRSEALEKAITLKIL